jgi:hypothetical protein
MYYYLIYACLWIFSLVSVDKNLGYLRRPAVTSIFIILYVTMAYRSDSVSPDQKNYRLIYNLYKWEENLGFQEIWYSHIDYLYGLFNAVTRYLNFDYRHFIYAYSLLNLSLLFFAFSRLSKTLNVQFTWAITFYFSHAFLYREMLQIRAGMAYAVCLLAIHYLIKRRSAAYYLCVILASLIHKSALILLLLPLWIYGINRMGLYLTLLLTTMTAIYLNYLVPIYAPILMGPTASNTYVLGGTSNFVGKVGLLNPTLIKYLILSLALYYLVDLRNSARWKTIFNIYILSIVSLIFFYKYFVLASRIASLFAIVEPLIIVKILSTMVTRQTNIGFRYLTIFSGFAEGLHCYILTLRSSTC